MGNSKSGKKLANTVGFYCDDDLRRNLESCAKRLGLSAGGFAREALLEKMMRVESELGALEEIRDLPRQIEELRGDFFLTTKTLLMALSNHLGIEVGWSNDEVEAWTEQNLRNTKTKWEH